MILSAIYMTQTQTPVFSAAEETGLAPLYRRGERVYTSAGLWGRIEEVSAIRFGFGYISNYRIRCAPGIYCIASELELASFWENARRRNNLFDFVGDGAMWFDPEESQEDDTLDTREGEDERSERDRG